jgi:uncharacterized protein (TIGR00369 family)
VGATFLPRAFLDGAVLACAFFMLGAFGFEGAAFFFAALGFFNFGASLPAMSAALITPDTFLRILREGMPSGAGMPLDILTLERGRSVLRMRTGPAEVRPGGTVSGPVVFGLADLAVYAAVLSAIGEVPLAVTTDATIHFLRRPRATTLIARARLLKEGQRLLVGEAEIEHEGEEGAPVAHAVMTYSVPPRPSGET